jgi:membrane protease subunit HflC
MMNNKLLATFIVVAAVLVALFNTAYFVYQWETAIKFRFGEFVGEPIEPGLRFKIPVVNTVSKFDMRIQTLDAQPAAYYTVNKEQLLVDSFVKWRIRDIKQYQVAVRGDEARAENRLSQKVNNSLRDEVAKRTISQVVSGEHRGQIMRVVQQAVNEEAKSIGVEVVDVRLKRVDLVDSIRSNVYRRMETERIRIANEKRAEGVEASEKIRADAERQTQILVAEAMRESEETRGSGDAVATRVYAEAYGQDEEFYALYRSLNAYKNTFGSTGDLMVLEPDSEFFKYFKSDK